MCDSNEHKHEIDMWCHDIIECCLMSDHEFPRVKMRKQCRPAWTSDVKPFRDDCMFWHKLWLESGSPRYGVLYDVKKYTKKQYMYANRRNKRKEEVLRKERMANAIACNETRDFFSIV
jgi:hypothetical protein